MKKLVDTISVSYLLYLVYACDVFNAVITYLEFDITLLKNKVKYRQQLLEKKIIRKRRDRKDWERRRNEEKNALKKEKTQRPRGNKRAERRYNRRHHKDIVVPEDFSFITNRDKVLKFIRDVKIEGKKGYNEIEFDFSDVTNISNGAITTLLSVTGWLKDQKITVIGNYPKNKVARMFLERSGFLDYFVGARRIKKTNNAILCRGVDHADPVITSREIRKAMGTVFGEERKNQKLQGMLIELMANTVNHAYDKHQKGWYFSLDHLPHEKKVKFCFVDNGDGILETIRVKFGHKILPGIVGLSNGEILENAFKGVYGSRTKLSYRGRGLPVIKRNFDREYIKSLKVISNNVFIDFETGEAQAIKYPFSGTFYFWELDDTCIE